LRRYIQEISKWDEPWWNAPERKRGRAAIAGEDTVAEADLFVE
jgi:hypothetical protein